MDILRSGTQPLRRLPLGWGHLRNAPKRNRNPPTRRRVCYSEVSMSACVIPSCFQTHPNLFPDSSPTCFQTHPNLFPDSSQPVSRLIPTCFLTHPKLFPDSSRPFSRLVPTCFQTHPNLFPDSPQHVSRIIPTYFADSSRPASRLIPTCFQTYPNVFPDSSRLVSRIIPTDLEKTNFLKEPRVSASSPEPSRRIPKRSLRLTIR